MALVKMISEEEATGRTKEIYGEIMSYLNIDFVPNLYKVMAPNPGYLEKNWSRVKEIMSADGRLDRLTKEIIAVTVSALHGCSY